MGCTLGGAGTLEAGGVPCVVLGTLGDRCFRVDRVRRGRSVVTVGAFVFPSQCSNIILEVLNGLELCIYCGCWCVLSAAVSCCTPCSTFYSSFTDGRVSLWCLNSMVSDTISVLVSLDTTFWQRYWSIAAPTLHPYFPLKRHEWRRDAFLCIITFIPKGSSGVASYWKWPAKYPQADIFRLNVDWWIKFNVISFCKRRKSHRNWRNSGAIPDRTANKCTLKVRIARSAAFLLWILWGVSCKSTPHLSLMLA